jgi:hypothetical protein
MPSFTTFYRAIVMLAVGVIVVKGWQVYGPTTDQVKSFAVRAIEMAEAAWNNEQPTDASPSERDDPRLAAAPVAANIVAPAPLFAAAHSEAQGVAASASAKEITPVAAEVAARGSLPAGVADRLPPLYSRLESLGASDPQLAPWGASGQMYRFCCRASLADSPALARHFEAVAVEPLSAVEQVVMKVEAWRNIRPDKTAVR